MEEKEKGFVLVKASYYEGDLFSPQSHRGHRERHHFG